MYYRDLTLRKALNQYKRLFAIPDNTCQNVLAVLNEPKVYYKSKPYYNVLKVQKELATKSFSFWKKEFENFDFSLFYKNKLKNMHIAKIKEFLFKIIHNICICKVLLFRWKLATSKLCLYCSHDQSLKHLIWDCNNSKEFWNSIGQILNINISFQLLIIGGKDKPMNNVLSVLTYLIHKKFVLDNEGLLPKSTSLSNFIKNELRSKIEIYNLNFITSEKFIPLKEIYNKI